MGMFFAIAVLAIFASGIAALNIYDHRRRAKMSPAQIYNEDQEIDREMSIW
jgi:hypothetical protein